MENSDVYEELNKKWKSTCHVLLGGGVGELSSFAEWLKSDRPHARTAKSSLSGNNVSFFDSSYPKNARWIGFEEIDYSAAEQPIDINRIKDIDSILEAVSERIRYCGNILLGEFSGIEKSTTILDSHYVYASQWVSKSKYIAYTTSCVLGECLFGGHWVSGSYQIRSNTFMSHRCFEVVKVDYSSDCYYSHGLSACHDCLFCFNLKSKRNAIGNNPLPKDKYLALKGKLLSEIREELEKNKRVPHVYGFVADAKLDYSRMKEAFSGMPGQPETKADLAPVEKAFTSAARVIFETELKGIMKYSEWLSRNIPTFENGASCASGKGLLVSDYGDFLQFPRNRLINDAEADWIGQRLTLSDDECGCLSFSSAPESLSPIAYYDPEWQVGKLNNNFECPVSVDVSNSYRTIIGVSSKKCAIGRWPRESDNIFGLHRVRLSSFCIRCFHSEKLQRCFEVLEGRNCSDCLYCHNIENVHDSMFCFNTKNKRYAIGNVELPKEKYLEIKKRVLEQLNDELTRTNAISLSIFNLLDRPKKQ